MEDDLQAAKTAGLAEELAELRALTTQLRVENARLLRLLELTPKQAAPPGPVQTGFFEAHPGPVDRRAAPEVKVDFSLPCSPPAPTSTPRDGRTRVLAKRVGCRR